jgi:hypothetical protein
MNEQKGKVYTKQQLEVIQVLDEKPYGQNGKALLPLMAKNLSLAQDDPLYGKAIKFTVFSDSLKAHLAGKAVGYRFLADVEERERPDSQYGPDRTVIQIYVDGQPVSQKKGGGGYGKSPETIRLEHELDMELEGVKRRSIEGQTAVAQITALLALPKPLETFHLDGDTAKRILNKYWQAVERGLDNYLAEPVKPQAVKPTAAPTPAPRQKPQDVKPAASSGEADKLWGNMESASEKKAEPAPAGAKKDKPAGEPRNLGELLTWTASHGKEFDRTWFFKNQSYKEKELQEDPNKVRNAYLELKQAMSW